MRSSAAWIGASSTTRSPCALGLEVPAMPGRRGQRGHVPPVTHAHLTRPVPGRNCAARDPYADKIPAGTRDPRALDDRSPAAKRSHCGACVTGSVAARQARHTGHGAVDGRRRRRCPRADDPVRMARRAGDEGGSRAGGAHDRRHTGGGAHGAVGRRAPRPARGQRIGWSRQSCGCAPSFARPGVDVGVEFQVAHRGRGRHGAGGHRGNRRGLVGRVGARQERCHADCAERTDDRRRSGDGQLRDRAPGGRAWPGAGALVRRGHRDRAGRPGEPCRAEAHSPAAQRHPQDPAALRRG